jgi:uncharacterized glyoxalase superfamily metalloenzyme YdcJ
MPMITQCLLTNFNDFPDTYNELREQKLAFFHYSICSSNVNEAAGKGKSIDELITLGFVQYDPIIYEDFLPVSAAGIFQSNLDDYNMKQVKESSNKILFEYHLGAEVIDQFSLYARQENQSITLCINAFK